MNTYHVMGSILLEGSGSEANYDFDMEWWDDGEPDDMDVLNYMMTTGILQIMHDTTDLITDEEEDED